MPRDQIRSRAGIIIFVCVGMLLCYWSYGPMSLDLQARIHSAAHPNYFPPSLFVWVFFALYVTTICIALIKQKWSTLPLWLISVLLAVVIVAEYRAEPDGDGYIRGLIIIPVVVPVAVQIAASLRRRDAPAPIQRQP